MYYCYFRSCSCNIDGKRGAATKGIQPQFDILKARHFDSSWTWVDVLLAMSARQTNISQLSPSFTCHSTMGKAFVVTGPPNALFGLVTSLVRAQNGPGTQPPAVDTTNLS